MPYSPNPTKRFNVITQIYTMQSVDEALAVAELGVDYVGTTPSDHGLPGEIDFPTARAITDALTGKAQSVALSVDHDLERIVEMVDAVRPDVLHLCGDIKRMTPLRVQELRPMIEAISPGMKILQAIPMTGAEALEHAITFAQFADMLILDSVSPEIDGIGAAGVTHDWSLSREVVLKSEVPVILAGGLGPQNVAEAIAFVRPWGVDSLTKTNTPLPSGGFRKDLEKIASFVRAAKNAVPEETAG